MKLSSIVYAAYRKPTPEILEVKFGLFRLSRKTHLNHATYDTHTCIVHKAEHAPDTLSLRDGDTFFSFPFFANMVPL